MRAHKFHYSHLHILFFYKRFAHSKIKHCYAFILKRKVEKAANLQFFYTDVHHFLHGFPISSLVSIWFICNLIFFNREKLIFVVLALVIFYSYAFKNELYMTFDNIIKMLIEGEKKKWKPNDKTKWNFEFYW